MINQLALEFLNKIKEKGCLAYGMVLYRRVTVTAAAAVTAAEICGVCAE